MTEQTLDHPHEHDGVEHTHERRAIIPQPVAQDMRTDRVRMVDGSERIVTAFSSLNGSWVVFFDLEGAQEYAQLLLRMAFGAPSAELEAPVEPPAPEGTPDG